MARNSGRLFYKAGNTPIVDGCDAALPKRRSNLLNPHGEVFSCDLNQSCDRRTAISYRLIAKWPSTLGRHEMRNAVEVCVQHLVQMPGKHKLHSVAQQKLVNRRLRHTKEHGKEPKRPMRYDDLSTVAVNEPLNHFRQTRFPLRSACRCGWYRARDDVELFHVEAVVRSAMAELPDNASESATRYSDSRERGTAG